MIFGYMRKLGDKMLANAPSAWNPSVGRGWKYVFMDDLTFQKMRITSGRQEPIS